MKLYMSLCCASSSPEYLNGSVDGEQKTRRCELMHRLTARGVCIGRGEHLPNFDSCNQKEKKKLQSCLSSVCSSESVCPLDGVCVRSAG